MEYQTNVIVDLTLKRKDGEVLWRLTNLSEARWHRASFGEVVSSTGGIFNEASKDNAVQETGKFMPSRSKVDFFIIFNPHEWLRGIHWQLLAKVCARS